MQKVSARLLTALVVSISMLLVPVSASASDPTPRNCGNKTDAVLLTFDDWPYKKTKWRFEKFVSILRANQTSAMFFTTDAKELIRQYPEYATYLRANGMWVGNHTLDHPHLTQLSDAEIVRQLSGPTKTNIFRAPYGDTDARVERIGQSLGMRHCGWSKKGRSFDTTPKGDTAAEIRDNVLRDVEPGSVVLLHLHTNAIYALQEIIDGIKAKGLRLCKLQPPTSVKIPKKLPC